MPDLPPPSEPSVTRFERLKYWVELAKWFMVSVVLVVATWIIDSGFKDRAAGIVEIQTYDKYVTDLIILNKEVGPRRLLAQYFAYVTPSEKLRMGWWNYYQRLDSEYQVIQRQDSTLAREQMLLAAKKELTPADSALLKEVQRLRFQAQVQLNTPVKPVAQSVPRTLDISGDCRWLAPSDRVIPPIHSNEGGINIFSIDCTQKALAGKRIRGSLDMTINSKENAQGQYAYLIRLYMPDGSTYAFNETASGDKHLVYVTDTFVVPEDGKIHFNFLVDHAWGASDPQSLTVRGGSKFDVILDH